MTHLPFGLAAVMQVKTLAGALALVDRIAGLTDWDAQIISATPDLREQVWEALNQTHDDFHVDRLPVLLRDALPAPGN